MSAPPSVPDVVSSHGQLLIASKRDGQLVTSLGRRRDALTTATW